MNYEDRVTKSAVEAAIAAAASGRARVATGSWVGTGISGAANPTTVTFPFTPKLVLVFRDTVTSLTTQTQPFWAFLWNYTATANYGDNSSSVTYSGNTMRVCYTGANNAGIYQMNQTGQTYTWLAIG